jgi:hypothetical protein
MFKEEYDGSDYAVVVELSDDYERDGTVVGYTVGSERLDDAAAVARIINQTGHQPSEGERELFNYTVAAGEDFLRSRKRKKRPRGC